jgi:Flagellar protein FliT
MSPWAALVALAERERELASAGRWEELAAASAERSRVAAGLPAPPPSARGDLARLQALQDELSAVLQLARAAAARELAGLGRGRRAARGYAATTGPRAATVDGRG